LTLEKKGITIPGDFVEPRIEVERLMINRVFALQMISTFSIFLFGSAGSRGAIISIDATRYGFAFPTDPAPTPGQTITPITNPPGQPLNQMTVAAGTYQITNGTGQPGADSNFTGWRFNSNPNWVWNFVIADNATNKVVFYGEADGVQGTQAAIAAQPAVQNYLATFTLPATTTLSFMIRDYFLPDNAGGMALNLQLIPEPSGGVLLDNEHRRAVPGSGMSVPGGLKCPREVSLLLIFSKAHDRVPTFNSNTFP